MTTLFLAGDVMAGRGIDQILRHPSEPVLYEPYVRDARDYVALAEDKNGSIQPRVDDRYIWGAALAELERVAPDTRIVNLETSITTSADAWPDKDIHYRMHPGNVGCLTAARIDCCVLANNHVLDWGYAGLAETLATLHAVGVRTAGAGHHAHEAAQPAAIDNGEYGRVLVFGTGSKTSGIPLSWQARDDQPGVSVVPMLDADAARRMTAVIATHRQPRDVVVVSVHWGDNWGYEIPREQRDFARALIESGCVDVVHGHSSHHPKGIEVYRERLILYGCGDLLNDYEGIEGHERYRGHLSLMYFATLGPGGRLLALRMVPLKIRKLRLERATRADAAWLKATLERVSVLDRSLDLDGENALRLRAT
jgi:poly-gamma-glutamate capsule biosynthesis protein CapA/YwtB (metallophosphatase superfamily)